MIEYKYCVVCGVKKEIGQFYAHKQYAYCGGHSPTCRECVNKRRRGTRLTTREVEYNKKYLKQNIRRRLYHSCKHRAKSLGVEFTLSIEDFVIPERCPYLGVPLTNIFAEEGANKAKYNPSVDRINPLLGYTPDNIEIISRKANTMKNNASREELIAFAENVLLKWK